MAENIAKIFEGEEPLASTLENNNLATVWRWCENRLPVMASPAYDGDRVLADYSSEERKDEESENPFVRRLSAIPDLFVLDGVMSDGVYWIDDILFLDRDLSNLPYSQRMDILDRFYWQNLSASDLFFKTPAFLVMTQADLEFAFDSLNDFTDSVGFSFRGNNYRYTSGESIDWIVLDSVRKLYENGENAVELNQGQKELELNKIFKTDIDKQIVSGVVLEPDSVDAQGDVISAEDIETAAHKFLIESRTVGFRHVVKAPASVVESFIAPFDFDFEKEKVVKGSWIMSVKINDDDLWKSVKEGDLNAFSIGGFGVRQDIDED